MSLPPKNQPDPKTLWKTYPVVAFLACYMVIFCGILYGAFVAVMFMKVGK